MYLFITRYAVALVALVLVLALCSALDGLSAQVLS